MTTNDSSWWLLFRIAQFALIAFWIFARNTAEEGRPSRPRQERMADFRTLARTVSGWSRPTVRRRAGAPLSTPSPRSHPMWDRDLDG
jgi:hypothetical protein